MVAMRRKVEFVGNPREVRSESHLRHAGAVAEVVGTTHVIDLGDGAQLTFRQGLKLPGFIVAPFAPILITVEYEAANPVPEGAPKHLQAAIRDLSRDDYLQLLDWAKKQRP